jgi:hypothetical protein
MHSKDTQEVVVEAITKVMAGAEEDLAVINGAITKLMQALVDLGALKSNGKVLVKLEDMVEEAIE